MNFNQKVISKGKIVYLINGQRFENSPNKRDGKEKAEQYCLDNFLNPSEIQKFDSRTECDRYEFLLNLQKQGLISNLGHHFLIRVQEEFVNSNGDTIPEITYEADFIYKDETTGQRVVEDVKGSEYFIDERFITIKQVFDYLKKDKGLYIKIMLYRNKEWVEYKLGQPKKSGKLIKKQREQIKEAKAELHKKEMEQNKLNRDIESYKHFKSLPKLNSTQRKRVAQLEEKLKSKGIML